MPLIESLVVVAILAGVSAVIAAWALSKLERTLERLEDLEAAYALSQGIALLYQRVDAGRTRKPENPAARRN